MSRRTQDGIIEGGADGPPLLLRLIKVKLLHCLIIKMMQFWITKFWTQCNLKDNLWAEIRVICEFHQHLLTGLCSVLLFRETAGTMGSPYTQIFIAIFYFVFTIYPLDSRLITTCDDGLVVQSHDKYSYKIVTRVARRWGRPRRSRPRRRDPHEPSSANKASAPRRRNGLEVDNPILIK